MAAQAIEQVVEQGQSLSNVLPALQQKVSDKDKALLQEALLWRLRLLTTGLAHQQTDVPPDDG
jgi:16S rRNA (cytosine967-C5)-methyltransferase